MKGAGWIVAGLAAWAWYERNGKAPAVTGNAATEGGAGTVTTGNGGGG